MEFIHGMWQGYVYIRTIIEVNVQTNIRVLSTRVCVTAGNVRSFSKICRYLTRDLVLLYMPELWLVLLVACGLVYGHKRYSKLGMMQISHPVSSACHVGHHVITSAEYCAPSPKLIRPVICISLWSLLVFVGGGGELWPVHGKLIICSVYWEIQHHTCISK